MIVSKLFLASCTISCFSAKSVGLFKTIQNHWLKELLEFYSHIAIKNGILHDSIIRSQGHKISALLILHHYQPIKASINNCKAQLTFEQGEAGVESADTKWTEKRLVSLYA